MAIYLLTSVTGAPGVTTTAIAWTIQATGPTLLVEADMTGGSAVLSGPLRGQADPQHTILSLAQYEPEQMTAALWWHTHTLPGGDRRVLPTITSPEQARALRSVWPAIGHTLSTVAVETGTDVVIDYGRLSTQHAARELLGIADLILVLTPATLAGINTTKRTVDLLRDELAETGSPRRLAVVPVEAGPGRWWWRAGLVVRPYTGGEIAKVLGPTAVLHSVRYDPDAAAVYSAGTVPPRGGTHAYTRSVQQLINDASSHLHQLLVLAGRKDPR